MDLSEEQWRVIGTVLLADSGRADRRGRPWSGRRRRLRILFPEERPVDQAHRPVAAAQEKRLNSPVGALHRFFGPGLRWQILGSDPFTLAFPSSRPKYCAANDSR